MSASQQHPVQFVTASPGPRMPVEQVAVPLVNGGPARMLVDPVPGHPGEWHLIGREGDELLYQQLAPERSHP